MIAELNMDIKMKQEKVIHAIEKSIVCLNYPTTSVLKHNDTKSS